MITAYVDQTRQDDWDEYLPYNTGVHCTTKFSSFEAMFGRTPKLPIDLLFPQVNQPRLTIDEETSPIPGLDVLKEHITVLKPKKKVTVEEGCTMRTAEKAAQRLSRAVDEAFPSDSEQDRRRRHGCQPKYMIGPASPRSGYLTSQLFISLVEPDLNYLSIQLLNKKSNSLGDQWMAEV